MLTDRLPAGTLFVHPEIDRTLDLASLDVVYRILSFVGLGIVLVGVSAWYQRTMARQKAAEADA